MRQTSHSRLAGSPNRGYQPRGVALDFGSVMSRVEDESRRKLAKQRQSRPTGLVSTRFAVVASIFPATCLAENALPLPVNDPIIAAIRERLCAVVERLAHHSLPDLASDLAVDQDRLRVLLDEGDEPIDVAFLIDATAAVVREFAIDPQWLLTGRYDPTEHRRALALAEDPSGREALRDFVREQYQRLRNGLSFLSWRSLKGICTL